MRGPKSEKVAETRDRCCSEFPFPIPPYKNVLPPASLSNFRQLTKVFFTRVRNLLLSPVAARTHVFGSTPLALALMILIALIQLGLPLIGMQQNFILGLICWLLVIGLSLFILWSWEKTKDLSVLGKLLSSIVLTCVVALPIWPRLKAQYRTEHPLANPVSSSNPAEKPVVKEVPNSVSNPLEPESNLNVRPSELQFSSWEERETYLFRMTNEGNEDLYSATFKFIIGSATLSYSDFIVDLARGSRKAIGDQGSSAEENADVWGFEGTDTDGRSLIYICVRRLVPKDFREITLTRVRNGDVTITAKAVFATTQPMPISMSGKQTQVWNLFADRHGKGYFTIERPIFLSAESPEEAQKRWGSPRLEAKTRGLFTGIATIHGEEYPLIVWLGEIMNQAGAPTAVVGWKMYLEFPGGRVVYGFSPPLGKGRVLVTVLGQKYKSIGLKDLDYMPRATSVPIAAGRAVDGWLWSSFKDINRLKLSEEHAVLVVEFSGTSSTEKRVLRAPFIKPLPKLAPCKWKETS